MEEKSISRREAIRKTSLGAAGLALAFGGVNPHRVLGANERIRVGFVGLGGRCKSLIHAFQANAKDLNMEIGAVCDIWNKRLDSGSEFVAGLTGRMPKKARNTDELWEMKDIEAVVFATADFQHAYRRPLKTRGMILRSVGTVALRGPRGRWPPPKHEREE